MSDLTDDQKTKLDELDQQLAKFESQKRWSDVIKTVLAKAELLPDALEKVQLYAEAGAMYIERSANQAEAIKCYQKVLEIDAGNVEAIERLKELYEKRRDWERLIEIMGQECELLDPADQALRRLEIARLGTERLRKPAVCIELWQQVLATDPHEPDALTNLVSLYDRAREWAPLADVMERQAEQLTDAQALGTLLQKLGTVYADKLQDDEGAVRAYRRLLEIQPDDRRAQEQLKKRYVAQRAWDELEVFYAPLDKWDELIRTFERAAEAPDVDVAEQVDLLFRAARLWQERKEKPDRAARAYDKILSLDPANVEAAEALTPIYEAAGDARKLAEVYEIRLQQLEDPDQRVLLLREVGLLYEERLRKPEVAFERFLAAFKEDPTRDVLRDDVQRLACQVKGWEQLIAAYSQALDVVASPADVVALRMQLGATLAEVGRTEDAIQQYRAVCDEQPDQPEAITALESLYREAGDHRELLATYQRRLEFETVADERKRLAYAIAELWEHPLEDLAQATETYQALVQEYGDDETVAHEALDRLFERQSRWEELAENLERRIERGIGDDGTLAGLKFRLATTSAAHLGDRARAVSLYREVLALIPEHDGAREALEGLLQDSELGSQVADILEPIYEERGAWLPLVKALEVLLAGTEDVERRLELYVKISDVHVTRLADARNGFDVLCRALEEAPENEAILARLEILGAEQGQLPSLVQILDGLAKVSSEMWLARTLWARAAVLQAEQLGDLDAAVATYGKVLERDPSDVEMLTRVEDIYRQSERWADLLQVLRRRCELASDAEVQVDLLAQMAFIHDEMLSEPMEAIARYGEILESDPSNELALQARDRLFEQQAMWNELAENAQRQLELASDSGRQLELMLRLASLQETRLSAVDAAMEVYREVLEREPGNAIALAALERLLAKPEHQLQIAALLETIYRDAGDFPKLIGIHEIQVRHSDSADQRVVLLHRMAELYEHSLDASQEAFSCYGRALAEDPANQDTQAQLERVADSMGSWSSLAETYEREIERVEDPALAALLHVNAAEVREERLGDQPGAIAHYRAVLALDASRVDAATALERLYQEAERYEELADIYLTKATMLDAQDERRAYYFRGAAIYEELLERPQDAVSVYHRVLEVEPDDLGALDKLIELYLRLEQWESLLGIYTRKADIVVDADEKKALFAEVGAVYERELGQVGKAIDTYQRILEIDPDDLSAIGRLDALYQRTENWQELLSVLERQADLVGDESEAISYRYRIGELWEQKLSDAARAVECYQEIVERDPAHETTLCALERMISAEQEPTAAALILEPVYRQTGDWTKLVHVLEVQAGREQDRLRRVELLHQIAELNEVHLENPQAGFNAMARALPLDSEHSETLASLERLAEQLGAWERVASIYDEVVASAQEPDAAERLVEMALRVAQIYEVQIGDVDAAITRYRTALSADPANGQAARALDRLYESTGQWPALADILRHEIEVASDAEELLTLRFRLGGVYEHHLNQLNLAIAEYREVLSAAPEHTAALEALEQLFAAGVEPLAIGEVLEPIYRSQDAWDKLVGVQELALRYQDDPVERVTMMHRLAEIAEDQGGHQESAFLWIQRAVLEDPTHDHSVVEAERLASATNGWPVLAHTYADVLETGGNGQTLAAVGLRLARVYEEELQDVERAEQTYRYVLGLNGVDGEILNALDRIYSEHAAHEALAEVLRRRITLTRDVDALIDLNFRLAQILEQELVRPEEAVKVYELIVTELDPQHEDSIHALQSIFTRLQDWERLYTAFERELTIAVGDVGRAEILGRMARLAYDRMGDAERAISLWRQVLDLAGEDLEALNALGNVYASQEKWADLVDVLEREVSVATDDDMRLRIHADLGRVWYERLGRSRNAIESWERVLDLEPTSVEAMFAMAEIHRSSESRSELVDALHRIVEVGSATLDDSVLEQVYMELAGLYQTSLEQPADAVDAYNRVLTLNPRNFAAMDALEGLYAEDAQWEECVRVRELRVDAYEDTEQKIAALLDVALVWKEQLENPDGGASALSRVLEIDPLHEAAFDALEALHRAAGRSETGVFDASRFEDLVELCLTRVEATEDVTERVSLLRKVATIYEKDLDDRDRAFDALQVAWTQDFSNAATAEALERMTGLTQRWNEVLTTANEALSALGEEDVQTKIAICLRCARWYGKEGHPEYAIPYLQQVLAIDPINVPAMAQMADLYRQTQQWDVYGQVLVKLVEMTEEPAEKARFYVKLAELSERHLGLQEQAIDQLSSALQAVPTHVGALEALERIYRAREQWQDMLGAMERRLAVLEDSEEVLETLLQIADVYEVRVGDPDEAIAYYRRVLDQESTQPRALKGLERLYESTEQWQGLLGVLERELEIATTERDRIALLSRIATMLEEQFLKLEKAAERLEQVIDIDPSHATSLQSLARLYRQMQRWEELIETYERHIAATREQAEKVALYRQVAETYEREKKDVDQAIDAYLQISSLDEDDVAALFALTKLYEKRGDHAQVVETIGRLSGLVRDPEKQVELHFRMARVLDEHLGDRTAALGELQKALDIDAAHLASLEAMRRIHLDNADWVAASRVIQRAAQVVQSPRRSAELKVELGRLYEDKLEEHTLAIECFEQALEQDADNEDAARPLVEEYTKQARWKDAAPLLQGLVRRGGARNATERHALWFSLAQCEEQLGDNEKAVKAFGEAYALDASHLASLQGLAAAHYRARDWEHAFKYYQMLIVHHREALTSEETTDVFYRLGVIKREQGEARKALNMFDKALEEHPHHRLTLEALIDAYAVQDDFAQVVDFKKRLLEVADDEERGQLLEEIGDLFDAKLKDAAKSAESYRDALDLRKDDHRVLHKLLVLYQSAGQWEAAIEIIERISGLDGRQAAKAKYAYTVGVILRDELDDSDAAIDKFNAALDLDPQGQLKAFESINRLLTQRKDWKQLERAYRKMLHRVAGKGDSELEFNLWHALGVIYRDRQRSFDAAAEAFKMASRLQPDNAQEHQILAEIFTTLPNRLDDAIAEHQWLLKQDPYRVESYRQLYKLYFDARAYDKAWCLAATLSFLKKADGEQQQFFEQYRQRTAIRPRIPLNGELWAKHLSHPEEDLLVGKLFESIAPAVLRLKQRPDKVLQLAKGDLVDFGTTTITFPRTFQFVAQVLGLSFTPRLFLCKDRPGGLAYAPTAPPASICGNALLSGLTPNELMFVCAKHLTLYRGEHYIRTLFQTKEELKLVLMAAMRIAGVEIPDPSVDQWAQQIRSQMQPADLELLGSVGSRFLSQGARTDIKRWIGAAELTSARAGLLLGNDLEVASKMVQAEPPKGTMDLPAKDKVRELVLFSVSESYFALREALGIGISIT